MDQLNDKSYAFHYQNLDSTWYYAQLAFSCSEHYDDGKAEALNNMAFVSLARMQYQDAFRQLDSVQNVTDNQIEILVADVQLMRLCQRVSRNKDFYEYYEKARRSLRRIEEEKGSLSPRMQRRMIYARSELAIVASTYYYYIGLERSSIESLQAIERHSPVFELSLPDWCWWHHHSGYEGGSQPTGVGLPDEMLSSG